MGQIDAQTYVFFMVCLLVISLLSANLGNQNTVIIIGFVHCDGYVYKMCYCGSNEDKTFYKLGNCYRTCEEAEANRDKWVKFYVSDEVLEV